MGCGFWLYIHTPSNLHSPLRYCRSDKPALRLMTWSKTSSVNRRSRIKIPMSFKARGLKCRAERCWVSGVRCGVVRCCAVQFGLVRFGSVLCGAVRCCAVRFGAVLCGAGREGRPTRWQSLTRFPAMAQNRSAQLRL